MLTFDLDFGDLLASGARRIPSVIIFRTNNQRHLHVFPRLLRVLAESAGDLTAGTVIIVEDARYRVRHLPI